MSVDPNATGSALGNLLNTYSMLMAARQGQLPQAAAAQAAALQDPGTRTALVGNARLARSLGIGGERLPAIGPLQTAGLAESADVARAGGYPAGTFLPNLPPRDPTAQALLRTPLLRALQSGRSVRELPEGTTFFPEQGFLFGRTPEGGIRPVGRLPAPRADPNARVLSNEYPTEEAIRLMNDIRKSGGVAFTSRVRNKPGISRLIQPSGVSPGGAQRTASQAKQIIDGIVNKDIKGVGTPELWNESAGVLGLPPWEAVSTSGAFDQRKYNAARADADLMGIE